MSFKEIKDEYKNTEGDPNVKAALRQRRDCDLVKRHLLQHFLEAGDDRLFRIVCHPVYSFPQSSPFLFPAENDTTESPGVI